MDDCMSDGTSDSMSHEETREMMLTEGVSLCENIEQGIIEPYNGMEFRSAEEARDYYNAYARQVGFSIRKGTHYNSTKKKMITGQVFTCSKVGVYKPKKKEHATGENEEQKRPSRKEGGSIRTGCKASLRVRMVEDNKWIVSTFVKDHNHLLVSTPSKSRFFRSHRKISDGEKELIESLHDQNISARQIMDFIASLHGGMRNMTFTRKDLSNHTTRIHQELVGIDISTTIEYFQKLRAKDPSFFYSIYIDEDNCAQNLFWVDGKSRAAYQYFGDVVTFDTTYMTNKYSMPFAPFVGVNHHRQSILFGCALIRNESAASFVWVFRTWLEAMHDRHPKSIITDEDPAMKKAIIEVFPNTVHRFCQWHVMRKARENLSLVYNLKEGLEMELKSCINTSFTVEEFESRWNSMIEKFQLEENKHLKKMYKIRHMWAPAFFRDTFFGFMSTTQRSESMNALFKDIVDCHMSIYKFVIQYEKALESRYDREDEEDFRTKNTKPSMWSDYPIEKHARDIYTRNLFQNFLEQLKLTTAFDLHESEANSLYRITQIEDLDARRNSHSVRVDIASTTLFCNRKMFEFSGMNCAHVLKVLLHLKIHKIPSHYVLRRWTITAKEGNNDHFRGITANDFSSKTTRFNALCRKILKLASEGSTSVETFEVANKQLDKTICEIEAMKKSSANNMNSYEGVPMNQYDISLAHPKKASMNENDLVVKDPPISACKGRRKVQRYKSPLESNAKKSRTCSKCNEKGHNARTCKAKIGGVGEANGVLCMEEISEEDELTLKN